MKCDLYSKEDSWVAKNFLEKGDKIKITGGIYQIFNKEWVNKMTQYYYFAKCIEGSLKREFTCIKANQIEKIIYSKGE